MPGQAHDLRETAALIEGVSCRMFLADRAFDANWLRANLESAGIVPVIPPKSNRLFPPEFDKHSYKWRHLIENYFQKLKEFKRIALRACMSDVSAYGSKWGDLIRECFWPPPSSTHVESQQALVVTVVPLFFL